MVCIFDKNVNILVFNFIVLNQTTKVNIFDKNAFPWNKTEKSASKVQTASYDHHFYCSMSTCFAGSEDCNPPAAEERTNERDISLDQNPLHTPPHLISSSAPIDSLLMQRRRRCCGWISDNEPNDICTKQLIPATMMQLEKLIRGTDTNSKSRWDEKPEWRPFWLFSILFMFSFSVEDDSIMFFL